MPVIAWMTRPEAVVQRLWLAYFLLLYLTDNSSGAVPG